MARKRGFKKRRRYGFCADVHDQIEDWIAAGDNYFTLDEIIIALGMEPTDYKHRRKVYSCVHRGIRELIGWVDKKGKVYEGDWDAFVKRKEYQNALDAELSNTEIWKLFLSRANELGIWVLIADSDYNYYQPDYVEFHTYRNQQLRYKAKAFVGAVRVHESIGGKEGMALPSGKTMGDLALPLSQTKGLLEEHMGATLKPEEKEEVDRDLVEIREKYLAYYVRAYDDVSCPDCGIGKLYSMTHGDYKCDECKTIIKEEEIEEVFAKKSAREKSKFTPGEVDTLEGMKNNYDEEETDKGEDNGS